MYYRRACVYLCVCVCAALLLPYIFMYEKQVGGYLFRGFAGPKIVDGSSLGRLTQIVRFFGIQFNLYFRFFFFTKNRYHLSRCQVAPRLDFSPFLLLFFWHREIEREREERETQSGEKGEAETGGLFCFVYGSTKFGKHRSGRRGTADYTHRGLRGERQICR